MTIDVMKTNLPGFYSLGANRGNTKENKQPDMWPQTGVEGRKPLIDCSNNSLYQEQQQTAMFLPSDKIVHKCDLIIFQWLHLSAAILA